MKENGQKKNQPCSSEQPVKAQNNDIAPEQISFNLYIARPFSNSNPNQHLNNFPNQFTEINQHQHQHQHQIQLSQHNQPPQITMCIRVLELYHCGCTERQTWRPERGADCPFAVFQNARSLVPEKKCNIGPCTGYQTVEFHLTREFCPNIANHHICVPKALAFGGFTCCKCRNRMRSGNTQCNGCGHHGDTCCYLRSNDGVVIS